MRPVVVLALLACTMLAGCSNPIKARTGDAAEEPAFELPELKLPEGQSFGSLPPPAWRPGYHYTYEDEGAMERVTSGSGFRGNQSGSASEAWGPRQGLNYTVVNVTAGGDLEAFGETRYLAVQHDVNPAADSWPDLLSFDPKHVEPQRAWVQPYCSYSFHPAHGDACPLVLDVYDEPDDVPILTFPLRDGGGGRQALDQPRAVPYVPLAGTEVVTRVLGYNEVDGPFGKVRAIHVRQEFQVNATRVLAAARQDAPDDVTDLNVTGDLKATRDVLYAPDLANILLDLSVSEGSATWSYRQGGQPQQYVETWRAWSRSRLTDATFDIKPSLTLEDIAALQRSPTPAGYQDSVRLASNQYEANTFDPVPFELTLQATGDGIASTRIDVVDASGQTLSSSTDGSLSFIPDAVGPYLAIGFALDQQGNVLARDSLHLYAYYQGSTEVPCTLAVEGYQECPSVLLPEATDVMELWIAATFSDGFVSPVGSAGRLVIDTHNAEISADRLGSSAYIMLERPAMAGMMWTVRYEPQATVQSTMMLDIYVWPGPLPSWVFLDAVDG